MEYLVLLKYKLFYHIKVFLSYYSPSIDYYFLRISPLLPEVHFLMNSLKYEILRSQGF